MVRLREHHQRLFELKNVLYYGDNLPIMQDRLSDESVDLVYLDPPFNKGKTYNVLFTERDGSKAAAQIRAFNDTWRWDRAAVEAYQTTVRTGPSEVAGASRAFKQLLGQTDMLAYLSMMAPRLVELRRVMRPTATLYLHCDPTASHYLKVLMDAVFGTANFRNELIWCYAGGGIPGKDFPRKHDVILRYTKTDDYYFKPIYRPYSAGTLQRGRTPIKGKYYTAGLRKEGTPVNDWWTDLPKITSPTDSEKVGYPTQKPLVLLKRIMEASSREGDTVLDPFCGCGTTVSAAEHPDLKRKWIGIDISKKAIEVIEARLVRDYGEQIKDTYEVRGDPFTYEDALSLAREDKYEFQWWVCRKLGANPTDERKGRDKGIDGRKYFHDILGGDDRLAIISVKGGGTGPAHVRDLRGVIERERAEIGVLVTIKEPTRDMRSEAAEAGDYYSEGQRRLIPRLQILTVKQISEGETFQYPEPFDPTWEPIREPSAAERQRSSRQSAD